MNTDLAPTSPERTEFETRVFNQIFIKSIHFEPNKQFATLSPVPPIEEIFARKPDGDYIDQDISAMWFGWQLARL